MGTVVVIVVGHVVQEHIHVVTVECVEEVARYAFIQSSACKLTKINKHII